MAAQDDNLTRKNSSANVTDDREARSKLWIAVYTKSKCEKKVANDLGKAQIETYVPIQTVEKQWSDRKKKTDVVIIPMVIFVNITSKEDLIMIKQDSRFVRILTYPGSRKPAIIPECQIENLRLMLMRAETSVEFVTRPINLADTVRVKKGNLEGLIGQVEQINGSKTKIIVSIDMLGGAMLEIDSDDLENFYY